MPTIDQIAESLNKQKSGSEALVDFVNQSKDTDDNSFNDEFFWQEAVIDSLEADIKLIGKEFDLDVGYIQGWFNGQKNDLIQYLEQFQSFPGFGDTTNPDDPAGVQNLITNAQTWLGAQWPTYWNAKRALNSGKTKSSGTGSGRSRPTAAEIRASFDLDELTSAINSLSRGLILSEYDGARNLAKSYVDQIVKNPDQELDFETFVRGRIYKTPRAAAIYKNKPESLSHEQYLQPYVQAASQMIGPGHGDQLADIATGGARLNADPNAFRARLQRTSQVQGSAPFLQNLGNQLSGVKQVLR